MSNEINNQGGDNIIIQGIEGSTINITQAENSLKHPKELTIKMPKLHLSDVIGREAELEELQSLLFKDKHVVLVNGLGGIGKTTLAQAYLTKYYGYYQHIAWLNLSDSEFKNELVNAQGLKESLNIKTEGKDFETIFYEILKKLKDLEDKPSLLLIDDAGEPLSEYNDILPSQPNWHILVTSRERIDHFHVKELGFLSPEKAYDLFRKHCSLIKDEDGIKLLLKEIDYHTLTIELLAKTAQLQRYSLDKLRIGIKGNLPSGVTINHSKVRIDAVFNYLSSIWDMSRLAEREIWLMKQLACLPSDFHEYELIKELICVKESKEEDVLPATISALVAKGWLIRNEEKDSYKMHMLIGEVVQKKLGIELADLNTLLYTVTEKLSIDQSKDNPADKFVWIPFGRSLVEKIGENSDISVTYLQNNLGLRLKNLGDYLTAKNLLEKALTIDKQNYGLSHPSTAISYSNLGLVLQDLGDYHRAKDLLEKALTIHEQTYGLSHPNTAGSYSNLGLVLKALGNYQVAKDLLEKAVKINEQNYGLSHPNTAISYSNLGLVYNDLGDCQVAKDLLEKAVTINEQAYGMSHPSTAGSYSNLGVVLKDLRDYWGAKGLLEKAYDTFYYSFGVDHPHTKIIENNLEIIKQLLNQ